MIDCRKLTVDKLANLVDAPLGGIVRMLEDLEQAGLVERCGGNHFRLTESAERRHGCALRELPEMQR